MRARELLLPILLAACGGSTSALSLDATVATDAVRVDVVAPQRDATTDVAASRTVLRVRYPFGARGLSLRGDATGLLDWTRGVAFRRVDDTTMEWSSDAVRSPFAWKPLLDDATWSLGPNYQARVGETVEVFPRFTTQNGAARRYWTAFHSEALGNTRGVWVYLPPSYAESPLRRYPVAYMHDGQNLFDAASAFGGVAWEADDAMNLGAADGTIREAIVVGVENNGDRIDEYTPTRDATVMQGGRADRYLRMLVDELKPLVDREFRTLTGPADTALVGSSLGGLLSVWIGVQRADVFGNIGAMSPSTWWDDRMILDEVTRTSGRPARPLRVWVDSGDSGPSRDDVENTRMLAAAYRALGYRDEVDLHYVVQEGAVHNESAWRTRLPDALRFLLGPRRE